ncbi:MAG TPA: CDGSH iron-sulfur domain-containing protein [Candidatus Acidoferrum sp.]|nr:CDGSH iron-sulfur domain-containing protein [Candidatus Acidoferrum sp.]
MSKNSSPKEDCKIKVSKNGPYIVFGSIPLMVATIACDNNGTPAKWVMGEKLKTSEIYSLCRCGQSNNKPFCDGSHIKANFDGTETSDNEPYDKVAKQIDSPELLLKDAEILCASARFCHRGGDIWDVVHRSNEPEAKKNVIENSCDCPSGRLLVIDKKTGKTIEPVLEKSICAIEDPAIGTGGPFWVRGRIPIYSADGKLYEIRNRVTICRCGKSTNKPFCDSSHYPEEDREPKKNL